MTFKGKTLDEHDAVFWMGDLNYRLSELSISREQVIQKCQNNDFKGLLKYDELLKQKLVGGTFADYQEAEINFGPTYKFEPGSTDWDESDKRRIPAWCDRIMFKSADKFKIELVENSYESVTSVITSDHKPVKAMFVVKKKNL
uniref:Inositol polyphosphate-related phosphatase domain-containing protein n=1 Tax=Ditylenchus dipsaci TaxID=166011 RepID=A0A915CM49_9BILA